MPSNLLDDEFATYAEGSGMLYISRSKQYANWVRKYVILLDGKKIAKIKNGQQLEFELPAGQHQLQVKIDWCKTKPQDLLIPQHNSVHYEVGCNLKGWKLWIPFFSPYYLFFKPSRYLYLKLIDSL